MAMAILGSIVLLSLLIQAGSFSPPANSALNAEEKLKIEKETNPNSRVKIYRQASERIQESIQHAVSKDDYHSVPEYLKRWTSLLSESLNDIESNLKSKKKSKNLIAYEIHVRKAISSVQSHKIGAPTEQQDVFDATLEQAEKIRKKFVAILFPGNP
jgi:hypothetical protein